MPSLMPFSVMCSQCKKAQCENAESAFQFIAAMRLRDWTIPDALENKPIVCPECKPKS